MFNSSTNINIIISIFILKLILALYLPLINDEAYTIAVSKSMSLSFYDHPPITFWLPVLMNEVFGTNSIFIYRLPFLLIGLITTLMIYLLGKEFGGREIGIGSALLYNIAPFFFLSGGIFIVPDGPLNLGIATTTYCILKLHKSTPRQTRFFFLLLGFRRFEELVLLTLNTSHKRNAIQTDKYSLRLHQIYSFLNCFQSRF